MIPPYIINNNNKKEEIHQIQLEIPDYSLEFEEWKRKQQEKIDSNNEETVIIIDIY